MAVGKSGEPNDMRQGSVLERHSAVSQCKPVITVMVVVRQPRMPKLTATKIYYIDLFELIQKLVAQPLSSFGKM